VSTLPLSSALSSRLNSAAIPSHSSSSAPCHAPRDARADDARLGVSTEPPVEPLGVSTDGLLACDGLSDVLVRLERSPGTPTPLERSPGTPTPLVRLERSPGTPAPPATALPATALPATAPPATALPAATPPASSPPSRQCSGVTASELRAASDWVASASRNRSASVASESHAETRT
jgi:hypothetical protein